MTVKKEIAPTIPEDLRRSVYQFGRTARLEGYLQDFCPHEEGSTLWRSWCAGWADMDAELTLSPLDNKSSPGHSFYPSESSANLRIAEQ